MKTPNPWLCESDFRLTVEHRGEDGEWREAGVILSREQVKRAVRGAQRTRAERLLRQTRRQARPETESLLRGMSP